VAQRKANETHVEQVQPLQLEIMRIFDAPRMLVYQMWSTPDHLNKWSAPKGFTIPGARTDFREGGSWYARMCSADGADHRVQGTYREIVEGKRIVMTHAWLDATGKPEHETLVTVTFEDHGTKTKMTFVQDGFASPESRDSHAGGWNECFDLLRDYLATVLRVPHAKEKSRENLSDREIVMTRLIAAPRELVFDAFKDRNHISRWWGPDGFTTTTIEMDVRPGGRWLFVMHGPDGKNYPNRVRYTEVRVPELLAYDHDGGDADDGSHAFKAVITFEPDDGKTRVTLRLICASKEQREMMAKFGAIEGGNQTLSRLEAHLINA
jgi:uncharacterized protein YndB with AHSA1/START domain